MRTDQQLLDALWPHRHDLSEEESDFLASARKTLGQKQKLPTKQHAWAEKIYLRLELDADEAAENLFSSGKIKLLPGAQTYPWETSPKPLKPPGRK
jgi:hypothetical protein